MLFPWLLEWWPARRPSIRILIWSKATSLGEVSLPVRHNVARPERERWPCAADRRLLSWSFNLRRFPNRSISSGGLNAISNGRAAETAAQSGCWRSWRFTESSWVSPAIGTTPWNRGGVEACVLSVQGPMVSMESTRGQTDMVAVQESIIGSLSTDYELSSVATP